MIRCFVLFFGSLVIMTGLIGCGEVRPERPVDSFRALFDLNGAKADIAEQLNKWLGKSKDERVKRYGPPMKCVYLNSKEEVCEWFYGGVEGSGSGNSSSISSWERHIVYTFDEKGMAQTWNLTGSLGEMSSSQYAKPF
jgi:hypothetical protein